MAQITVSWEPKGRGRIVGLHRSRSDHKTWNLERLFCEVRTAHAMGFKGFQLFGYYGCLPYTTPMSRDYLRNFMEIEDISLDRAELRSLMDDLGLRRNLHIHRPFFVRHMLDEADDAEFEDYQRQIVEGVQFVQDIGSDLVSFHPPYMEPPQWWSTSRSYNHLVKYRRSFDTRTLERLKDRFAELIQACLDLTTGSRVRLAIESFPPPISVFDDADDLSQFVRRFGPRMGVMLDTGHWYTEHFDLRESMLTFADRLFDIHAKDGFRHAEEEGDEDWEALLERETSFPIGDGDINWALVVETLKEIDYDGMMNLEVHGTAASLIGSRLILERLIEGDDFFEDYFHQPDQNTTPEG